MLAKRQEKILSTVGISWERVRSVGSYVSSQKQKHAACLSFDLNVTNIHQPEAHMRPGRLLLFHSCMLLCRHINQTLQWVTLDSMLTCNQFLCLNKAVKWKFIKISIQSLSFSSKPPTFSHQDNYYSYLFIYLIKPSTCIKCFFDYSKFGQFIEPDRWDTQFSLTQTLGESWLKGIIKSYF